MLDSMPCLFYGLGLVYSAVHRHALHTAHMAQVRMKKYMVCPYSTVQQRLYLQHCSQRHTGFSIKSQQRHYSLPPVEETSEDGFIKHPNLKKKAGGRKVVIMGDDDLYGSVSSSVNSSILVSYKKNGSH